jgi:hypothetical protein
MKLSEIVWLGNVVAVMADIVVGTWDGLIKGETSLEDFKFRGGPSSSRSRRAFASCDFKKSASHTRGNAKASCLNICKCSELNSYSVPSGALRELLYHPLSANATL